MSSSAAAGKLKIPLQEILSATDGFAESNVIGKGGYGLVYQGLHGGARLAIKRLNRVHRGQGDHEYGMEISLLSKYKHENLVSLVGFCGEDGERILVYKYEPNQSLDRFLHHHHKDELSWMRRLRICLGAARGLSYLHNETGSGHGSVIHRDVKSSNILLDENWNAKISDFGLSKIAITNSPDSVMFTLPCGTMGYIDPQILYGCGITQKSDVYSFGVVLYEVLFGKLVAIPEQVDDGRRRFTVAMARKHFQDQTLHMMIDPGMRKEMSSDSLSTFSDIAYRCLKERVEDRPAMSLVVEELKKALGYQQAMMIKSSTSSVYDVFICFYELDTERVVNRLRDALKREGLSSEKSEGFQCGVSAALKQSRAFIIIFSKNFAGDTNRMDEVAAIMDCVKEKRNVVMPVYWDVKPSDVREQKGHFGDVLYTMYAFLLDRMKNAIVEATSYEPAFEPDYPIVDDVKAYNAAQVVAKIKRRLLGGGGGGSVLRCSNPECCLAPIA